MTDTDPGIGCLEALDYLVLHRLMGNQPAQGGAALPGGAHRAEQDAAHRQVEVGAWRQDHRVVAAQFEDAASETRRHPRRHFAPHASAAGGADQGDATVVHQRFAGLAVADQQLAQVRRRIAAEGPRGTLEQCLAGQCGEGVFSEGFQTTELPQTSASAVFHDHTATGKLNALITPTTPSGCQVSRMWWPGRSDAMVRPYNWRERPTAKSQISIISGLRRGLPG